MLVDERLRQESVQRYRVTGLDRPDADFAAHHILDGSQQVRIAATPGAPLEESDRLTSLCQRLLSLSPLPDVFVSTGR